MVFFKTPKINNIEHTTEDDIRKAIIAENGYVIKNQATNTTGRGKPDLSACIKGHYYGIEVKRPAASVETTLSQLKNLKSIARAGGYAYWSKTPEVVNENLLDLDFNEKSIRLTGNDRKDLKIIKKYLNNKDIYAIRYVYDALNAGTTDILELYLQKND